MYYIWISFKDTEISDDNFPVLDMISDISRILDIDTIFFRNVKIICLKTLYKFEQFEKLFYNNLFIYRRSAKVIREHRGKLGQLRPAELSAGFCHSQAFGPGGR